MKHIIIRLALIFAITNSAAGPAMMAPELRQAPRLHLAVEQPSASIGACAYSTIKAAVLMREVLPSLPALTARCGPDAAFPALQRLEDEGIIERISGGWRVK